MILHKVKIDPIHFEDVITRRKRFEIRNNDRNYKLFDEVSMREFTAGKYTGRIVTVKITYITEFMQEPGNVVFGFSILEALV